MDSILGEAFKEREDACPEGDAEVDEMGGSGERLGSAGESRIGLSSGGYNKRKIRATKQAKNKAIPGGYSILLLAH